MTTPVVVVGIGADGWDGLSPRARRAVEDADVLRGSARQLALVPDEVPAERLPWPSPMTPALAQLGGPAERSFTGTAASWPHDDTDPLVVTAVEAVADPGTVVLPTVPGLPDAAFEDDGQLTKREVRAVTLSRLAPVPGQLLWDVGGGAGSIGIEWMRTHPTCRAVTVEAREDRAARIRRNAVHLGVPGLEVVVGWAPEALAGLPVPDAVFVGGGATVPGVLEDCWAALTPGGRLVVNAVTVESEAVLAGWWARVGGDLVRIAVQRAEPVGGFTGWKAAMPVTIWSVVKP